jgi:hypothetical protein
MSVLKVIQQRHSPGFTRIDVIACMLTAALLFAAMSSAFCYIAGRQDETVCANNLRAISQGFAAFANEHRERYPWQLGVAEWNSPFREGLWYKFVAISNYLHTPRLLADPADQRMPNEPMLSIASSWGLATGGLMNPNYRNNAVSYFVTQYATPLHPQTFVSGDRNLFSPGLFSPNTPFGTSQVLDPATTRWSDRVHANVGHVAFTDGAVERTDSTRLREIAGWWGTQSVYTQKPFTD